MEGSLLEASAAPVVPEVTARLTQDGLVIIVYLSMTRTTRVNGGCTGVLSIKYHGLTHWVNFFVRH